MNRASKALLFWGSLLSLGPMWWGCEWLPLWAPVFLFGRGNSGICLGCISPWHGLCVVQMLQAYGETQSSLCYLENKSLSGTLWNVCLLKRILSWGSWGGDGVTRWPIWGKLKCFSMKGGILGRGGGGRETFISSFPQRISSFGKGEQLFFIQRVFNFYLMWRKNSDHSQRGFNDRKMVSWLIISYHAFPPRAPTDRQHGRASLGASQGQASRASPLGGVPGTKNAGTKSHN